MKKIIFILFLFVSCYFIYEKTYDEKINYVSVGDGLSKGVSPYGTISYGYSDYIRTYLDENKMLKSYNKSFASADYRIIDVITLIEKNMETNTTSDGKITINQLLNKADVISISIGMNELYYKLEKNIDNIYEYIDNMMEEIDVLFEKISSFDAKIYVLGYYNVTGKNDDIFTYANTKLKSKIHKYKFTFINTLDIVREGNFVSNMDTFYPNTYGYKEISRKIIAKIKKS